MGLHESFDEDYKEGDACPMCIAQNKNNPFIMRSRQNYIRHIGSTHRIILDFIPKEEPHLKMLEFLKEPNLRRKSRKSHDPMSSDQAETTEEPTVKNRGALKQSTVITPSKVETNESSLDVKKPKGGKRRSKGDKLTLLSPPGPKIDSVQTNGNEEKLDQANQPRSSSPTGVDETMTEMSSTEEAISINVAAQAQLPTITDNKVIHQVPPVEIKEKKKVKRRSKAEMQAAAENVGFPQTDPKSNPESLPIKKKPGRKPTKIPVKSQLMVVPSLPQGLVIDQIPSKGINEDVAAPNPTNVPTTSTTASKSTTSQSTEDLLLSKLTSSITVERKATKSSKIQIPIKTQKPLQCGECSVSVDTKQELLKHMKLHM